MCYVIVIVSIESLGNGTSCRPSMSSTNQGHRRPSRSNSTQRSRSPSLQSNNSGRAIHGPPTLVTTVLANKMPSNPSSGRHRSWTKCWPWQSSSSKRNSTKASNILIQISDVEEMNVNDVLHVQPREQQPTVRSTGSSSCSGPVDDEEVAFV